MAFINEVLSYEEHTVTKENIDKFLDNKIKYFNCNTLLIGKYYLTYFQLTKVNGVIAYKIKVEDYNSKQEYSLYVYSFNQLYKYIDLYNPENEVIFEVEKYTGKDGKEYLKYTIPGWVRFHKLKPHKTRSEKLVFHA